MADLIDPAKLTVLRSLKKCALLVLLLFNLRGPVDAKRLSHLAQQDYQTTRKYLAELRELGIVCETADGWILTAEGPQMLLVPDIYNPVSAILKDRDAIFLPERENIASTGAVFSRSESSPSAACDDPFLLQEEEEEEEVLKTRFSRVSLCLETLAELGITNLPRVLKILEDERITPEYIEAQAERLEKENRWSTGLLLTVMRCFDPVPLGSKAKRKRNNTQNFPSIEQQEAALRRKGIIA